MREREQGNAGCVAAEGTPANSGTYEPVRREEIPLEVGPAALWAYRDQEAFFRVAPNDPGEGRCRRGVRKNPQPFRHEGVELILQQHFELPAYEHFRQSRVARLLKPLDEQGPVRRFRKDVGVEVVPLHARCVRHDDVTCPEGGQLRPETTHDFRTRQREQHVHRGGKLGDRLELAPELHGRLGDFQDRPDAERPVDNADTHPGPLGGPKNLPDVAGTWTRQADHVAPQNFRRLEKHDVHCLSSGCLVACRVSGAAPLSHPMPRTVRALAPERQTPPAVRQRADKYFSKVIGKALDLIAILRTSGGPLSLNDLTSRLELAKSSVFRILHTLEVSGYIERDAEGRYSVAPDLRASAPGRLRVLLVDAAMPPIKELSREFRETVSLAMHFENRVEVVATLESPHLIRMGNTVGRIVPPHASSLGKAIAAFQREEVRDRLIRSYGIHRFTELTITDEVDLRREFERVRVEGFSRDAEESVLEGCCFGAPILDSEGHSVAAISVSSPKMRMRDDQLQARLIASLRRAAHTVARSLAQRSH